MKHPLATTLTFLVGIGFFVSTCLAGEAFPLRDLRAVRKVAEAFAESAILGTGARQYVNSVKGLSHDEALAVLGELNEGGDYPDAYSVTLKRIKGQWRITNYEFVETVSGKKRAEVMKPPFPAPYWKEVMGQM